VPAEDGPARERRKLMFSGIVVVAVSIGSNMKLADDIELVVDGLPSGLQEELAEAAEEAYESMPKPRRRDDAAVEEAVRHAVRRKADHAWGKKPVCRVIILRV